MSGPIASFDENAIRDEMREMVRQTVGNTLNRFLGEEADNLVGAERYKRMTDCEVYCAEYYYPRD